MPDALASKHNQPDWLDFVINFMVRACEKSVLPTRQLSDFDAGLPCLKLLSITEQSKRVLLFQV